ncbi:MAG: tRNA (adenosine(37)-N6)-dimethylallyltransferase MiaA [Ignavibacteria bacterium]
MLKNSDEKVLTLVGPTASGKTEISILLSHLISSNLRKKTEIISADSRQIYKNIPIATSQPPPKYLMKVKHHFMNELELDKEFNAGEFGRVARIVVQKIFKQNKVPIIVGGSGLYVNSLIYGLFDFDELVTGLGTENEIKKKLKDIRKKLYSKLEEEGINNLFIELKKVDPLSAKKIILQNKRRIIRALEVYYLTGVPISEFHQKKTKIRFKPIQIGLHWDRTKLYDRINNRVDKMIKSGLIEEITKLKRNGYSYKKYNSLNTVGVKEVFDYLEGKIDYNRMVELIKQNTRRFAKKQITWFRKDKNIFWISLNDENDFEEAARLIFNSFYGIK